MGSMKHVDMRKLPAAAQEERRRQVIGLRQGGMTYEAIAAQVGLSPTGVLNTCHRYAERGAAGLKSGPRGPGPRHCLKRARPLPQRRAGGGGVAPDLAPHA